MSRSDWQIYNLGDLTENFDSIRVPIKRSNRKLGPYPYYGASGIVDYVNDYLFDGEYLLIAEDGENLRTRKTPVAFMANGKFWVNNHAHIVQGSARASTRFLHYSLANTDLSGHITGSTIPKLSQTNMNQIKVLTPPLPEQQAIASILGALDDKIDLNRRMNETLESMARAIFKSWFVDFDPVRAKMEGKQPFGMDAETAALFPDRLVESELGLIPEGWKMTTVGNPSLCSLVKPGVKEERCSWKYIATRDIVKSSIKNETLVDSDTKPSRANMRPGLDRIWFAKMKGSPKFVWTMQEDGDFWDDRLFSTGFAGLEAASSSLQALLYTWVSTDGFDDLKNRLATGTTMQAVNNTSIKNFPFILPKEPVSKAFDRKVRPMFRHIWSTKFESRTLAELRDLLLPKLLSGEIRVKEAEQMVEAAV